MTTVISLFMSSLPEFLINFQLISRELILLGLFVTASVIIISQDWRTLVMTLLIQYILVGLILAQLVRPDIAILKVMIGAFICPVLFLSARQVSVRVFGPPQISWRGGLRNYLLHWGAYLSPRSVRRGMIASFKFGPTGAVFRLLLALLIISIALSIRESFPLPNIAPNITMAIYWLFLAGLMTLALTEEPTKAGIGLLTTLTGFDLYYSILERSLLITGLWGSLNLLTALAIGYLIVAQGAVSEDER